MTKTHIRDLAACLARVLACSFRPLRKEGAGNAGRPMRPIAACAEVVVAGTRVSQVTPEIARHSPRNGLRLTSCSPRRPGFFATVAPEKLASQGLDASVGASGPHDFAVRLCAVRHRRIRVHRIPSRVRDDREPPLCGTGRREYELICSFGKSEYFCKRGWTRKSKMLPLICPTGGPAAYHSSCYVHQGPLLAQIDIRRSTDIRNCQS
jgi:hypothetical protein